MRAVVPPTPDTLMSWRNNSRSVFVEKPKKSCASSRTTKWVKSFTSLRPSISE